MKKLFGRIVLPLLLSLVFCLQPVSAISFKGVATKTVTNLSKTAASGQGFVSMLENENYVLAFRSADASIAVVDKKTNIIRYSNPLNASEDDLAVGGKGDNLKSQVMVQYYEKEILTTKNSFGDCIKFNTGSQKTLTYEVKDDVLYVHYIIGDASFNVDIIPTVIPKERMEEILSKVSEDDKRELLKRYKPYFKSELDKAAYEQLVIMFPCLEKHDIYARDKIAAYKGEAFYKILTDVGYTQETAEKDYKKLGMENPYSPSATFEVTLEYELTEDGFRATVDPEKIGYLDDFKPVKISILPYFGAADQKDSGYIFVPDGSGSLIYLNNNKYTVNTYEKRLFETDNTFTIEEIIAPARESVLPVFALSGKKSGFYATIDSGYEEAGVAAGVAGNTSRYNNVYAFFDLVTHGYISYGAGGNVKGNVLIMTDDFISCDLSVSYHFVDGGTTYSQIAVKYRELLQKNGLLPTKSRSEVIDLNVKLIGSAYVRKRFLGIPYTKIVAMTDYKEAAKILDELGKLTTTVNYVNALPGGSLQSDLTGFKPLSVLGNKKSRTALEKKTESLTFSYYAQHATSIKNSHAAKKLDRSNGRKYWYDLVGRFFQKADSFIILSPSKLSDYASKAIKKFDKYNIDSVNIMDLGYLLSSDFKKGDQIDRYSARKQEEKYLSAMSKEKELSVSYGSIYSFKYADKITEIPVTHTGYKIEDRAVPFYQIVISGLIPYSTESVNLADEGIVHFLKTVEVGGQLQYSWYYEKPENLIYTREDYYGMDYSSTIDDAKAYAKKYSSLYEKIAGKAIVDHEYIQKKLTKTVYENGITVYVNYSKKDVTVDGKTVAALDYTVIGG